VDSSGDLVLTTGAGDVRLRKPAIYQESGAGRREIAGAFAPSGTGEFGFTVAGYDRARPLVIDPVLAYSTYLGGSAADSGSAIVVDSAGGTYVTGETWSIDFPRDIPAPPSSPKDVFVTKLNPGGTALIYSAYYGGTDDDSARALAIDSFGNAYVTGITSSADFPTVNALQPTQGDSDDAFVAKFDDSGRLVYSTYYGGASYDYGYGIAADSAGNAYVVGTTRSSKVPAAPGGNPGSTARVYRAFVAKLDPAGTGLVYHTYFGADDDQTFGSAIAIDSGRNAYITGTIYSAEFTTADAFVAKFSASGSPVSSMNHGGSDWDLGESIALDAWGNVYVAGVTGSSDFPVSDPLQRSRSGEFDAFVTKFNHLLNAPVYSTYLGGSAAEWASGIRVDSWGNAYIAGETTSIDFPTVNPIQPTRSGGGDAFVAVLNRSGSALTFSTYLGGTADDSARGIALAYRGRRAYAYVTGSTGSSDFPTVNPLQGAIGGPADAFVVKIADVVEADDVTLRVSPVTALRGRSITASWSSYPNAAAGDWIGLYESWRTPDYEYLARTPTSASGSASMLIPLDAPFGATYEVRLFSNDRLVATSHTFTVQPSTLTVHSDAVIAGQTIGASWAYIPNPRANDWIGLYAFSLVSDSASLASQFTDGRANGSTSFAVPADAPAGTTYELRLFSNGRHLATSDSFTIRVPTLTVSPTKTRRGGIVTATWANIPRPAGTDWIGVYSSPAKSDTQYVAYYPYPPLAPNGAAAVLIPPTAPRGARYELRLFSQNSVTNTRLATSNTFRVEEASLRVSPTTVLPGQAVGMTWSGIQNPTPRDWIGLYPSSGAPNRPSLSWMYIPPVAGGGLVFAIPADTVPGTTYELRLFSNDGYSRLATSQPFTVQAR
jgi:hypothetical protein